MSSYWDNNGRYQALHNALWELIPPMGEVANAAGNPALERYRKACKIYRDIFNNGACNYPWGEIRKCFGIRQRDYALAGRQGYRIRLNFPKLEADLETPMSDYILAAAIEQFPDRLKITLAE